MPHRDFLEAARREKPDITLQTLCDRLLSTTNRQSRHFDDEGTSFAGSASRSKRPSSRASRIAQTSATTANDGEPYPGPHRSQALVFIDETWTKTNMTRLRGWKPEGERLVDKVPHGRWKTATFLAALRNDRIDAPCLFDGPINGERFHAYVEQFLVPTLKPGDVVILDNLGSHKGKVVRRAIRNVRGRASCSCRNTRRPQSGEQVFAQFKTLLQRRGAKLRSPMPSLRSDPHAMPAKRMRRTHRERRLGVNPKAASSSTPNSRWSASAAASAELSSTTAWTIRSACASA